MWYVRRVCVRGWCGRDVIVVYCLLCVDCCVLLCCWCVLIVLIALIVLTSVALVLVAYARGGGSVLIRHL